jgi:hypothetical protein
MPAWLPSLRRHPSAPNSLISKSKVVKRSRARPQAPLDESRQQHHELNGRREQQTFQPQALDTQQQPHSPEPEPLVHTPAHSSHRHHNSGAQQLPLQPMEQGPKRDRATPRAALLQVNQLLFLSLLLVSLSGKIK